MRKETRWLWNRIQEIRLPLLLSIITGVSRVCASLLFVWVCKQLIDIATHTTEGHMGYYTGALIAVVIAEIALSAYVNRLENRNDIRLKNVLRHSLFSHFMVSVWNGKERFHSGDTVNRLEEDVRVVTEAVCKNLPSFAVTCFQLVAATLFLFRLDSRLAGLIVLIMPLFLVSSKIYMKRMRRLTKEIRQTDSRVQSHIQENIQHKILIQTLEQNEAVNSKLNYFQHILYGQTMKRINFTLFSRTLVMAGFASGYVATFLWGVNGIYQGIISFGLMTAFLQLVGQIQRPMVDISSYLPSLIHAVTSAERLIELDSLPAEEQGGRLMLEGSVGICFENVSFAYPDGDRNIIASFSHDFLPGSRTAVVGQTGTGKSTLIRLMLDLLHLQEGKIYLHNNRRRVESGSRTRCNLVYVPQGNTLLSGTIRENLLLGNPNATDKQLDEALTTAAAEFVYALPEGVDTLCGEKGTGLSEGQAQRICIARGLLRPGSILLLDELSSSLDKETERLLMERLIAKTANKTLIFITHRDVVTEYCGQVVAL